MTNGKQSKLTNVSRFIWGTISSCTFIVLLNLTLVNQVGGLAGWLLAGWLAGWVVGGWLAGGWVAGRLPTLAGSLPTCLLARSLVYPCWVIGSWLGGCLFGWHVCLPTLDGWWSGWLLCDSVYDGQLLTTTIVASTTTTSKCCLSVI